MKLQAALFFLSVGGVVAQRLADRKRDGLIESVVGYTGMTYYSARWEPLCGSTGQLAGDLNIGQLCTAAMDQYTNDTRTTLAFYDAAGVKLVNAGVGLGKSLCLCFSMATNAGAAYDICWAFNEIGQYLTDAYGDPYGSVRPGATKNLPHCGNVDVNSLQAQWTRTAVMPQATGPVLTLNTNTAPTTVLQTQTVTHVQTSTLTPTLVNLTITSSTIVTDSNGRTTTQDRSYTTTAAVINFQPAAQPDGLTQSDKIALGVGLTFGLATLGLGLWTFYETRRKRRAQRSSKQSIKSSSDGLWSPRLSVYK